MKKFILFIIPLFSCFYGFSQNKELSKVISDSLNTTPIEIRLTRIAKATSYYNTGDIIQSRASFSISSEGELLDIRVRAPIPGVEQLILEKLKNILIPVKVLEELEEDYKDKTFALPINFQLKSEAEIIKIVEKEKRKKQREEWKNARKKARKN